MSVINLVHERRIRRLEDTRPFAGSTMTREERLARQERLDTHIRVIRVGQLDRLLSREPEYADYHRPLTKLSHRDWPSGEGRTVAPPKRSLLERIAGRISNHD